MVRARLFFGAFMTDATAGSIRPAIPFDRGPVWFATLALAIGTLAIWQLVDLRQAVLFLIGSLLGLTLYHASFGFTGGWRRLVVVQEFYCCVV